MNKKIIISLFLIASISAFATARDDMQYIDKLYQAKEYEMATDELKTFVKKYENKNNKYEKIALERLVKTLYINKNYSETIKYSSKYLEVKGLTQEEKNQVYYYVARSGASTKKFELAQQNIDKISGDEKNINLASYYLGVAYYRDNNYEKAEKLLQPLESKLGVDYKIAIYLEDIRYRIFISSIKAKKIEKANLYYKQIKDSKKLATANYLLGNYYLGEKNNEKAMFYYKKLIGTKYNSEGLYYVALINYNAKKYTAVIHSLSKYDEKKMKHSYIANINIFLGKSYYETKNYGKAKYYFEKNYKRTHNVGDLYQLILVNSKMMNKAEIERLFKEYKKTFPNDKKYRQKIYLLVGNTYYRGKEYNKAKLAYSGYLKHHKDEKISENYITILVATGSYKELITYLTPQPKTPENTYLMGIGYLGLTEYEKSISKFNKMIADNKSTAIQKEKASYKIVEANFMAKNYLETVAAAKKYQSNVAFKKYSLEVLKLEGLSNFRKGNYEEARKNFRKLGENKKYKDYSQFQIAETYYNEGKYDLAYKSYDTLYRSNKKGGYAIQSFYWEINILYIQGKYQGVISAAKEFNLEYPKSDYLTDVEFYRAKAYIMVNDTDSATKTYIALYNTATTIEIKDKAARALTTLYYNAGDFVNANIWKEKINSGDEKIYLAALIYEKQGKKELARVEYKKLSKSKEYASKANLNLANGYYEEKNYDQAKIYYENIVDIPDAPYKDTATYRIGQIYLTKKDYSKALRNFMRIELVYEQSSLREAAKLKIAKVYELQKRKDKEEKAYEAFSETYPNSKYESFVLEKLVVININNEKLDRGKKYYNKLKSKNPKVAKNYESYFVTKKGGENEKNN